MRVPDSLYTESWIPGPRELVELLVQLPTTEWYTRATQPQPRRQPLTPVLSPDDPCVPAIRALLRKAYFTGWSEEYANSPDGRAAVDVQAIGRYNDCVQWIVPWVTRHIDLAGKHLIDLGCGTGSSTAAFAGVAKSVVGYDIEEPSIAAARGRSEVLGQKNTTYVCEPPSTLLGRMKKDHPNGTDAILCYAVLEHQTFEERTETLRTCWELLRPGGVFVIADTPNRLTYNDTHTSLMPFFHMLPHEVAVAYAGKSPRKDFADAIERSVREHESMPPVDCAPSSLFQRLRRAWHPPTSRRSPSELLIRWGRGVSFQDFEIAMGDLSGIVVGDGFDPEILSVKPLVLEEVLLGVYAMKNAPGMKAGFYRRSVDVVLRKSA